MRYFLLFVRNRQRRLALAWVFKSVVGGLCGACRHMPSRMLGAAFYRSCLFMIRRPALASVIFHHLVSISRRRGFSFNCACQLELVSQNVMAAQRARAPPRQNQRRIIPPHVSFTVLLSPKPTSRHSQYPAC